MIAMEMRRYNIQKAQVSWEPISSRLITATFRTKQTRILARFIMGYAPTNDAAD